MVQLFLYMKELSLCTNLYRQSLLYLFCDLLPHSCKHGCSVDILLVSDMRDVHQNGGLAMDEAVQDMFLKSWQVIGDLLALAHVERVVAVGEEDGLELAVVIQEVALVDVGQLDLVLLPHTAVRKDLDVVSMDIYKAKCRLAQSCNRTKLIATGSREILTGVKTQRDRRHFVHICVGH